MTRSRRIPAWQDVTAATVAELLGLSLTDFEARRPVLNERGFPHPDPVTGLYCIEAVERSKAEVSAAVAAGFARNPRNQKASEMPLQVDPLPARDEPSLEEPRAARRGRVEQHGDAFLHFCVDCGRFGPYGYGVHMRAGQLGRWFCHKHRPQHHELARR